MARLAQESDLAEATISRLEAGKMPNASFDTLHRIARALEMKLEDLALDVATNPAEPVPA